MTGDEYAALQQATQNAADTLRAVTGAALNLTPESGDLRDTLGAIRPVELAAAQYRGALVEQLHGEGFDWQELAAVLAEPQEAVSHRYG